MVAQISQNKTKYQLLGIILCHPHPEYGGSMLNNVIRELFYFFHEKGILVVRFNFRGIGGSSGNYGNILGEREDVIAVCNYLLSLTNPPSKLIIIGYSFGAVVGCSIVDEIDQIAGYVSISYPFTLISNFISQSKSRKPKLFITGEKDKLILIPDFEQVINNMPSPKNYHIVPNADHYWIDNETHLVNFIENWISNHFQTK